MILINHLYSDPDAIPHQGHHIRKSIAHYILLLRMPAWGRGNRLEKSLLYVVDTARSAISSIRLKHQLQGLNIRGVLPIKPAHQMDSRDSADIFELDSERFLSLRFGIVCCTHRLSFVENTGIIDRIHRNRGSKPPSNDLSLINQIDTH